MNEATAKAGTLGERLNQVRTKVAAVAECAGRNPGEVTLIAVSKTHPVELLREAIQVGATDFGENRVQEAEAKVETLGRDVRWHLIGNLQTNKARKAVRAFDVIHTVDSIELATRLDRICQEERCESLDAFVQVDLAGEITKSGANEQELPALINTFAELKHLKLVGLMTLPPFFDDAELVRPYFRRLRELRDEYAKRNVFADGRGALSMGMSNDYTIAIEEGATHVRVGTAIFGQRPKAAV